MKRGSIELGEVLRGNSTRIPFDYAELRRVYVGFLVEWAELLAIRGPGYRAW